MTNELLFGIMYLGHHWAEIKYGDKTGWVKAMFLNTERPYGADNSKVAEAPKDEKASAQASSEAPKSNGARRYIGKNEVFLYESPTMASDVLRSGHLGEEVTFLGEKKKTNGFEWAKVSYKGKVGWVKADDLRVEPASELFDSNAPKELIVKGQQLDVQARSEDLYQKTLKWVIDDIIYNSKNEVRYDLDDDKQLIFQWLESIKPPQIIYTGPYCVPVRKVRINQGFYGLNSHAGKNKRYETGYLGAIDFQAPLGTPVYSVLGGKVVYTYKEAPQNKGFDMHRVTVETKINGEIYYLEYLHMDEVNVEIGQTLYAGTQLGKSGGWGSYKSEDYPAHLDFRVYKFKDDNQKLFYSDSEKQFFDPLQFFDFDEQFNYNMSNHDYH